MGRSCKILSSMILSLFMRSFISLSTVILRAWTNCSSNVLTPFARSALSSSQKFFRACNSSLVAASDSIAPIFENCSCNILPMFIRSSFSSSRDLFRDCSSSFVAAASRKGRSCTNCSENCSCNALSLFPRSVASMSSPFFRASTWPCNSRLACWIKASEVARRVSRSVVNSWERLFERASVTRLSSSRSRTSDSRDCLKKSKVFSSPFRRFAIS
mmetsp:Transcript_112767/g.205396  ORF Transcript_112767/g.205396 Transcript_112767/m.205396 type:complete len:215 (+) Transcript_112767:2533-3177(+)